MSGKKREIDLGPPVIAWLQDEHWDVYQEVTGAGGCADIVATCGPLVAVVELKLQMSWELLEQARRWRSWAHLVWVAVPEGKGGRSMAVRAFDDYGIGVVKVGDRINVYHRPAFNRRAEVAGRFGLREHIQPQHKTFAAAGCSTGKRWTPFKSTCEKLTQYVRQNPGCSLRDALGAIDHHYSSGSSARAHVSTLIQRGVITGLRIERDGKRIRLYTDGAGPVC